MEEGDETPPFWSPSSTHPTRADRLRRRFSSIFLNTAVLFLLLLLSAMLFVFIITPRVLSLATQIFRPSSIRRKWDTLNLLLVLIAIAFGFLGRRNDDRESPVAARGVPEAPNQSAPGNWYEYDPSVGASDANAGEFMRKYSSSYPDLRQRFSVNAGDRWRFSDDTEIYEIPDGAAPAVTSLGVPDVGGSSWKEDLPTPRSQPTERSSETVPAEEKAGGSASAPPAMGMVQPTPPVRKNKRRARRSSESVARKARAENLPGVDGDDNHLQRPEFQPSPPPVRASQNEQKRRRDDKKTGGSNPKEFLTSLYHQRKRKKKQRHKSLDTFDHILDPSPPPLYSPPHPWRSPPPPPFPPPSIFKNLFYSKKNRTKRSDSIPPPQPPTSTALPREAAVEIAPVHSRPEPISADEHLFTVRTRVPNSLNGDINSGTRSPSIPIPPPLPPFRIPNMRFAVHGDFVRLLSDQSSRSISPEPGDTEVSSPTGVAAAGVVAPSLPCPSPDVDTKADSFISRFRARLKLERVNSVKAKQSFGLSGLGHRPSSGPKPESSSRTGHAL